MLSGTQKSGDARILHKRGYLQKKSVHFTGVSSNSASGMQWNSPKDDAGRMLRTLFDIVSLFRGDLAWLVICLPRGVLKQPGTSTLPLIGIFTSVRIDAISLQDAGIDANL